MTNGATTSLNLITICTKKENLDVFIINRKVQELIMPINFIKISLIDSNVLLLSASLYFASTCPKMVIKLSNFGRIDTYTCLIFS